MKKFLISSVMLFMIIATATRSNAQVSVSVNIGVQPDWGPVGYDYVDYYYLPEYEIYYYVPKRQFVYFENGQWIFVSALPPRYKAVNLYSTYKVVINEPKPYVHFDEDKVKYAKYKGGAVVEKQVVIRDSKDPKYVEARRHPAEKAAPQKNNDQKKEEKKNNHPDDKHPDNNKPN